MNMDLPLIEAVKSNPCLYNKSSLTYRNKLRREVSWLEVAASVGANVETVQARWKALRDRYVKELTKLQKCGKTKCEIKWKYASKMSFLRLHLKTLPMKSVRGQSDNNWAIEDEPEGIDDTELAESAEKNDSQDPLFNPMQQQYKKNWKSLSPHCTEIKKERIIDTQLNALTESVSTYSDEENVTDMTENEHSAIDDLNELIEITETDTIPSNPYIDNSSTDNDRITALMDAVTHLVTSQVRKEEEKSRNTDFLKVLDTYLLQLPDTVQDELKVEMLNLVFNRQKKIIITINK